MLLPGLVDLHTHLREPGREDAETVETGTLAAALGGFTAVHAMANTDPVADTAGVVEQVWRLGRDAGHCDVAPGRRRHRSACAASRWPSSGTMADSAARVRVFSDDGQCVSDAGLMRRALEYVKAFDGVIAQHAQEPRLTVGAQMNEGVISSLLGLTGWPAVAEEAVIARDCLLTAHVGSRLHVCHVSTAGSVELDPLGQEQGLGRHRRGHAPPPGAHRRPGRRPTTRSSRSTRRCAPPPTSRRCAPGLADGTIDVVATDHAPHALEDKEAEWGAALPGMTGLETALAVVVADDGRARPADLAPGRRAAVRDARPHRPARRARPAAGRRRAGQPRASSTPARSWTVDPRASASRSRNTPFAGRELPSRVVATFLRGTPTVLDGAPA